MKNNGHSDTPTDPQKVKKEKGGRQRYLERRQQKREQKKQERQKMQRKKSLKKAVIPGMVLFVYWLLIIGYIYIQTWTGTPCDGLGCLQALYHIFIILAFTFPSSLIFLMGPLGLFAVPLVFIVQSVLIYVLTKKFVFRSRKK